MTSQTFFQAQFLLPAPYSIFHIETFHFNVKPQVVRLQRKSCFVTTRMRAVSRRYWLARTSIRNLTKLAYLSGHRKASW
jgi:ribosomal protein S14